MRRAILASAVIALSAGALATAAFADDDCYVPMSRWQTRDAVRDWAERQGWRVRRIKIDDGCYEIKGRDGSGREIEVKVDPSNFAIVEFEYEDDDDDDDYRRKRYRNRDTVNVPPAGPVAPVNPPDNGLFTPGSKPGVVVK